MNQNFKPHPAETFQSPFTEETWTKAQWEQYVAWEESRIAQDRKHDCTDCNGCQKCESI